MDEDTQTTMWEEDNCDALTGNMSDESGDAEEDPPDDHEPGDSKS